MVKPQQKPQSETTANIGYEAQLWNMADALRGAMEAPV